GRRVRPEARELREAARLDAREEVDHRVAREGRHASEALVEHRAEREDVGARRHALRALDLLEWHVADGPAELVRLRERDALASALLVRQEVLREAEVRDERLARVAHLLAGLREEDVLRLHVAVDDPERVRVS